ncbi:MAG: polyketide cyclase [Parvibaculum sp.]|nr:polyketide cyclase [Parvibaculum sp.]
MRKFIRITAFIIVAAIAIYGIGRVTGPSVYTEIEIAAPASAVWAVLADTEGHADWNPLIISMEGEVKEGAQLRNVLQLQEGSTNVFSPTVLVAEENTELRWLGSAGVKGIFDGEHYFLLEETDRGTTLFRHGENFSGFLSYPIFAFIGDDTKAGFEAMNAALKERVEGSL